eukprot:TRINITY_DN6887_c0_g2_i2.p1 TRINITY_DN6887_c0_g2~~TRINITY_DN6887_c0_g2_i2.p1  ORF type:complete len:118 (+),score=18.54 TRINITY_DN6887_c0_g2_i2:294-647(+)
MFGSCRLITISPTQLRLVSNLISCTGPVNGPVVRFTNSSSDRNPFVISSFEVEKTMGIEKVMLVNDFVSNGYGLITLSEEELVIVQEGETIPDAPIGLWGRVRVWDENGVGIEKVKN